MADRHRDRPNKNFPNSSQSNYHPGRKSIATTTNIRDTKSEYHSSQTNSNNRDKNRNRLNQSATELPSNEVEHQLKRRRITPDRKYPQTPDAWEKYKQTCKIGQGTFGEVFKATLIDNDKVIVAMKRVLMDHEKEGFPITALREIKILQTLNRKANNYGSSVDTECPIGHENIVRLIEVCREVSDRSHTPSVFLVFEFCEHDLHGLLTHLKKKQLDFTAAEKKSIVQQMLRGLMYVHGKRIFHRDMKTSNVLVTQNGVVKLADFGLARPSYVTSSRQLTNNVVTLWYRPPELILGDNNYSSAIDIWGCGCIMAELWTKAAIFSAKVETEQYKQIMDVCGSIDPEDWPKVTKLKNYLKMTTMNDGKGVANQNGPKKRERQLKNKYGGAINDSLALSLLDDMLKLNPEKRISANSALDSYWLWLEPLPERPDLKNNKKEIKQSYFELLSRPKKSGNRGGNQPPEPKPTKDPIGFGHKFHEYTY